MACGFVNEHILYFIILLFSVANRYLSWALDTNLEEREKVKKFVMLCVCVRVCLCVCVRVHIGVCWFNVSNTCGSSYYTE